MAGDGCLIYPSCLYWMASRQQHCWPEARHELLHGSWVSPAAGDQASAHELQLVRGRKPVRRSILVVMWSLLAAYLDMPPYTTPVPISSAVKIPEGLELAKCGRVDCNGYVLVREQWHAIRSALLLASAALRVAFGQANQTWQTTGYPPTD